MIAKIDRELIVKCDLCETWKTILLANYVLLACSPFYLLLFFPAHAQVPEPKFSAAQAGTKTVFSLSANWTKLANNAELVLESSKPIKKAVSSAWWNATAEGNKVNFTAVGRADTASMFYVQSNSTDTDYTYELLLNGTK